MRNVLLVLVNLLTCVLTNAVCINNGVGGSIFVCRNASFSSLKDVPRYARSIKFINSTIKNIPANTFARFHELKSLSLVNCSIRDVESFAFRGLSQLRSLNLSRNSLSRIKENAFCGLRSLEKLDLTVNTIEAFEDGSFGNLSNIGLLDLRYNNLSRIDDEVLRPLSRASTLDVRFNKLRCVASEVFNDTRPKWFYIGDNPWDDYCWATLTRRLYMEGIYYGKDQAFDTLTKDRLIWNATDQALLLSEEQAEEKTIILREAEGWKKYYDTVVQEIADERERLEDLALASTEAAATSGNATTEEDGESSPAMTFFSYGRAFIVWILTVCKILPPDN